MARPPRTAEFEFWPPVSGERLRAPSAQYLYFVIRAARAGPKKLAKARMRL